VCPPREIGFFMFFRFGGHAYALKVFQSLMWLECIQKLSYWKKLIQIVPPYTKKRLSPVDYGQVRASSTEIL